MKLDIHPLNLSCAILDYHRADFCVVDRTGALIAALVSDATTDTYLEQPTINRIYRAINCSFPKLRRHKEIDTINQAHTQSEQAWLV